ncbi:transporter substrate-binding domain-containing protein [Lentilactobacillus otakiensis]|uniref:transporter substrate-binding domain-containing protein n=1 Tax=Lentilactobacillus otakiensis TaxID=481720 RepID=UPI003D16BE98
MSKKGYIYSAIVVVIVVAIGAAHFLSTSSSSNQKVTTINVAGVTTNRPYTFPKGGKISGYDGELLQKIDKDLPQYKFNYSTASQNSVFVGLQSGKYDLASSGFWYSADRAKTYLLSKPVGLADLRLVYRSNEGNIKGFQDIVKKHLKLAPISSDDARYNVVEDYNKQNPKYKVNLKAIGDVTAGDALKQLQEKQFDAVFYPYQAYFPVRDSGGAKGLTVSPSLGLKNDYFYANKSDKNKKLLKAVNADLKKLKKSGYLEKLSKKWLGEDVFKLKGAQASWDNDKN